MLWEIVDTPHRLLGSVHVLPEKADLPMWATECHLGMKRFVFESDYRDPSFATIGLDKSGAHLTFPEASELYAQAAKLLASLGNVEPFDGLRPWRAAFYVAANLLPSAGLSHAHGMDNRLRLYADRNQLDTMFLESPTRAFELLDSSCKKELGGLRFFKQVLVQTACGAGLTELRRILSAWFDNDLSEFATIYNEKLVEFPYIFQPLITQRNREWITAAKKLITDQTPTLFIVGSLHTVGPDSFIQQLGSEGIKLIQISKK